MKFKLLTFSSPTVVLVWASQTLVSQLAMDASVPDPLMQAGDRAKVALLPGTLLANRVELESVVKRAGRPSIMAETHLYGVVQGGPVNVDAKGGMTERIFATKQQAPPSPPKKPDENADVKEDEWD